MVKKDGAGGRGQMAHKTFLKVKMCPFCGSEGSMGTWFDPLTEKMSTDFYCDVDATHHCFIVRLPEAESITMEEVEG